MIVKKRRPWLIDPSDWNEADADEKHVLRYNARQQARKHRADIQIAQLKHPRSSLATVIKKIGTCARVAHEERKNNTAQARWWSRQPWVKLDLARRIRARTA